MKLNFLSLIHHKDNVIKVWRVFPFAEEALAPLMSFYCAHTPLHMTVMKTILCVAFQDPSSATYSIVHYNLNNKSKWIVKGNVVDLYNKTEMILLY